MTSRVYFRCDANPQLGMGHLVRCRALASAFRTLGVSCAMVGPSREYKTDVDEFLFALWEPMPFAATQEEDAIRFVALMEDEGSSTAVLDDYRINEHYQITLRDAGIHWLQFNGKPSQPLWADLILNPNPQVQVSDYENSLRNANTKLLLGPRYAILRPEFQAMNVAVGKSVGRRIFLSFGGGDDRGAIIFLLRILLVALPRDTEYLVVSGEHNPRNKEIADWIDANGERRVDWHVNPPSVAEFLVSSRVAIIAGGGTTYEANYFGVPMVLIAIADNQILNSLAWQEIGCAQYLGELSNLDSTKIIRAVTQALEGGHDPAQKCNNPKLVDGLGGVRVARQMMEQIEL